MDMDSHHSDFDWREKEPSQSQCNNKSSDIRPHSQLTADISSTFSSLPQPYHHKKNLVPKPVDLDSEDRERLSVTQRLSETRNNTKISQRMSTKPARPSHLQPPAEKSDLRHKLSNGDYSVPDVSKDSDAHIEVGSHVSAAPNIGAEAPEPPLDNVSDVEEATDDVEFPEAVVLVGKTHWRCVTCMAHYPRSTSIDAHMNQLHPLQASTQNIPPAPKRGRGRGRGMARGRTPNPASRKPHLEIEQRPLRSSLRPVQGTDQGQVSRGRWASALGKPSSRRGRGRGLRGSKSSRGRASRGRGGRGRGRVFTKPLTSDDSDTETDVQAQHLPPKVPRKRKTRTSSGLNEDEPTDMLPPPPSKKPKTSKNREVDDAPPPEEIPVCSPPPSPEPVSHDMLKDLMKEKYVVIVEKAGTSDYPSECDYEAHIDSDPPLPIETPSLQADALLPPATPVLPDIHGPPETPVLPDTPHPPGTPHQADTLQPAEMPDATDSHESTQPHKFLPPETPGILPAAAPESVAITERRSSAGGLSSSQGPVMQHGDSNPLSVCVTCGAPFDSPAELKSHREEMIKFDVVSCSDCGDKFHGLHQLNIHVFTTHEKFAKKFCFLCDADCLDGFELEEHLLEHTSNGTDREDDVGDVDSIQHLCKTCGSELAGNLSDLMNHYHTAHNQFICSKCYELFTDVTEYEDHKVLHASDTRDGDAPVVYTCPVSDCFQMCSDKEALMDHISWHEDRDLDEEQLSLLHCQHCNDLFRNKVSLQRHLAETHNEPDLKPFVCELCSENFSHSLELHRHNTIHHAGIKRYGCAYCNQRFAFRSSHRRHVASEHDVAATVLHM